MQRFLNGQGVHRWWRLLVGISLLGGLVRCGSTVDQSVKNAVFGLNADWAATAQRMDKIERKLLEAKTIGSRNLQKIQLPGGEPDSAQDARIRDLRQNYRTRLRVFKSLWQSLQAQEKAYQAAYEDFAAFHSQVEKDEIASAAAKDKIHAHRDSLLSIQQRLAELETKTQTAIRKHNRLIGKLRRTAGSFGFSTLEPLPGGKSS